MMEGPDQEEVRQRYNSIGEIWPENDVWHFHTRKKIESFLKSIHFGPKDQPMLIAGSAGDAYNLEKWAPIHIDIAERKLSPEAMSVAGSINNLPFANESFGSIVCVGSVLNYASAFEAFNEFHRTLRPGGRLIAEFETSNSLEYLKTHAYRKPAYPVKTFYQGNDEIVWVYSRRYIEQVLANLNLKIVRKEGFHCVTPLLNIESNGSFNSKLAIAVDNILSKTPLCSLCASNVMFISEKCQ